MSRRAQRSKACPTPSKMVYYTEDEASQNGQRIEQLQDHGHRAGRPFYIYRCACTRFHLTHHEFSADGTHRRNRRAGT